MTQVTCPWYVYEHCGMDGKVFYVGKGKGKRCNDLAPSRRTKYHLNTIKKRCPTALVIAITPCATEEEAFRIERETIAKHRASGVKLCNLTDGGEGASGRVKSPQEIEKIRAATKARWDRQGRKDRTPKPYTTGVAPCEVCGAAMEWKHRPKKLCSRKCANVKYRAPYVPSTRPAPESGYRYVYKTKHGRWTAGIPAPGGKVKHIGTFDTPEEANAAIQAANEA